MTQHEVDKIIDLAIRESNPGEAITFIISQLSQQPIRFESNIKELDEASLQNFIQKSELFNNRSYYIVAVSDFDLYDTEGNKILSIEKDGTVKGYMPRFTVPSDNDSDNEAFRQFAYNLITRYDTVCYPEKV